MPGVVDGYLHFLLWDSITKLSFEMGAASVRVLAKKVLLGLHLVVKDSVNSVLPPAACFLKRFLNIAIMSGRMTSCTIARMRAGRSGHSTSWMNIAENALLSG